MRKRSPFTATAEAVAYAAKEARESREAEQYTEVHESFGDLAEQMYESPEDHGSGGGDPDEGWN
jgi:hypothetical protein